MLVRSRLQLVFLVCLAFLLVNCRSSNNTQGPEISLNFGFDPPTIDPALATDPPTIQVDNLIFMNLVGLNEDGTPEPALASEWFVSTDGLIWEFHLRDDVNWVRYNNINGNTDKLRAVTANDVVYSVRRLFDPRTQSTFASKFASVIRNATPFNDADPRTSPQDLERMANALGVRAKDEHTVQFSLSRPDSAFPSLVAAWLGRIVPQEPIADSQMNWTEPGTMWSSGPYMLESWEHSQYIVLRRNPYYVDAANVQVERLRFRMIPDVTSALDAYLGDNLDTTDPYDSIEGDQLARVDEDRALAKDKRVLPGLCTQYFTFDVRQPPFNKAQVRRAFATAIDRETIADKIFKTGQVARWFTPPEVNAAPDISTTLGIDFNAPQAKELLDQSGWSPGSKEPTTFTFLVNANDTFIEAAVSASQNWKAALSLGVQIDSEEWTVYLEKLKKETPTIFRMGYCASYPDAANFAYDVFHSGSEYNFTHWSSSQYDRLVEQAARETDVTKRRLLYTAAEKMLIEDQAVIIPLLWTTRVSLTKARIQRTFAVMEGFEHMEKWKVNP